MTVGTCHWGSHGPDDRDEVAEGIAEIRPGAFGLFGTRERSSPAAVCG